MLRQADLIILEEIRNAGLYDAIWQALAVLLLVRTVGVMGDARSNENVCAPRAVTSLDGMTADFFHSDKAFLGRVANRILNEVRGINRVVYDATSNPRHHGVGVTARYQPSCNGGSPQLSAAWVET